MISFVLFCQFKTEKKAKIHVSESTNSKIKTRAKFDSIAHMHTHAQPTHKPSHPARMWSSA